MIRSETFLTYVSETVHAPDQASAERTFEVPFTDLVELGTDPELVIPTAARHQRLRLDHPEPAGQHQRREG